MADQNCALCMFELDGEPGLNIGNGNRSCSECAMKAAKYIYKLRSEQSRGFRSSDPAV